MKRMLPFVSIYRKPIFFIFFIIPILGYSQAQDISPNATNGKIMTGGNSETGIITELAGTQDALYAIGLNSGVWKSANVSNWRQLHNSPRYSASIAVNPLNEKHLIVGEHAGEISSNLLYDRTGIWESFDAGETWTLTWSSTQIDPVNREIKAITFTSLGSILFAAEGRIFRRTVIGGNQGAGCFSPPHCFEVIALPAGVREIVSFSVTRIQSNYTTLIWAVGRGNDNIGIGKLIWSLDDGQTWSVQSIPDTVNNLTLEVAGTTIAGYGDIALVPVKVTKATSLQRLIRENICCGYNTVALLYYSRTGNRFYLQFVTTKERATEHRIQTISYGDGTGLGGRQRLRNFSDRNWANGTVGTNIRIYYEFGQDVLGATGFNANTGLFDWERIAVTHGSGQEPKDPVHCDIWDVHFDPGTQSLRLATDGGVFLKKSSGWEMHNGGLHTHHNHNLVVLPDIFNDRKTVNIAYPTHDNDAWYTSSTEGHPWKGILKFGDADCVDADQAVPGVALLWRLNNSMCYTSFDKGKPPGAPVNAPEPLQDFVPFCTKDNYALNPYFFPRSFRVIQTLPGENPQPLLDVVLLAKWPLYAWSTTTNNAVLSPDNNNFESTALATADSMILIRNTVFLASPDAKGVHPHNRWKPVARDFPLPKGTKAVWVSNGHHDPVYYLLANDGTGNAIWRFEKAANPAARSLFKLTGIGSDVLDLTGGWGTPLGFGPLYVNPYDPNQLIIVAKDGIRVSPPRETITAATKFLLDTVLTNLVTSSGTYQLDRWYWGGRLSDAYKFSMSTCNYVISGVSFNRDNPHHVLVGSPVSGLFVSTDESRHWKNLTPGLPKPFTQVAGVAIDGIVAYAALEGRGIWRIINYGNAKPASYFRLIRVTPMLRKIGLFRSDQTPVVGATVKLIAVIAGEEKETSITTDRNGILTLPTDYTKKVVRFIFSGDRLVAGCSMSNWTN